MPVSNMNTYENIQPLIEINISHIQNNIVKSGVLTF